MGKSKSHNESYRVRFKGLFLFLILIGGAIILRAAQIQLIGDKKLDRLARRQFESKVLVRPKRGAIFDRNGVPLAVNSETRSLAANPKSLRDKSDLVRRISRALKIKRSIVRKKIKKGRDFVWIKRHLSDADLKALEKHKIVAEKEAIVSGLWLVKESRRYYPQGEVAAQLLGNVDIDSLGLEGVELWFDEHLRGHGALIAGTRDALGRSAFVDTKALKNMTPGKSVRLTIDSTLQFETESLLKKMVLKKEAKRGSVVVMNAVSGEILALANYPFYNPNKRKGPVKHRRNRIFTDGYEPGSTMKSVLMAAALENGYSPQHKIHGEDGSVVIQGRRISEAESHEKFKDLTLPQMLSVSSNVVAAKLAMELGPEKYIGFLEKLGFADKTDSRFPGEIRGRLPDPKNIKDIRLANMGFGHGFLTTPIQMVRAYASFANGGWLVQPRLVAEPESLVGASAPQQVFSARTSQDVTDALLSVTKEGTGTAADIEGFEIAGKTGTSQKIDPETKRYSRKDYLSTFIGFAINVNPQVVVLTMIDQPKGNYYASETAAPLFKEVFGAVARRFAIAPKKKHQFQRESILLSQAAPIRAKILNRKIRPLKDESGEPVWKMPDLSKASAREVLGTFEGKNLRIAVDGIGFVVRQRPAPGEPLREGDLVTVTLSR